MDADGQFSVGIVYECLGELSFEFYGPGAGQSVRIPKLESFGHDSATAAGPNGRETSFEVARGLIPVVVNGGAGNGRVGHELKRAAADSAERKPARQSGRANYFGYRRRRRRPLSLATNIGIRQ